MASQKLYDICLRGPEYTTKDGSTKAKWDSVGAVFKSENGNVFIMLKATFNPAGVEREQGRDSIMLSCFPPKDKTSNGQSNGNYQGNRQSNSGYYGNSRPQGGEGWSGQGDFEFGNDDGDVPF